MMATEILAIPEESLPQVIAVIRAGLQATDNESVREALANWCDEFGMPDGRAGTEKGQGSATKVILGSATGKPETGRAVEALGKEHEVQTAAELRNLLVALRESCGGGDSFVVDIDDSGTLHCGLYDDYIE
jgi:hypothetical protein